MFEDLLGPGLSDDTVWPASDAPIPAGSLADIFDGLGNIHKSAHFVPIYDSTFRFYRDLPVRVLEIGVACGGSLELWRQYFCADAVVVGVDGNPQCGRFDDPARGMYVRVGQQQDVEFLKSVVDEFGPFDIILDDGSHIPSYTLSAFRYMFLHGLRDGGVYLVEDIEWCYWPSGREPFENELDANDGSPTFVEFAKSLVDVMHAHYLSADSTDAFEVQYPDGEPVDNLLRMSSVNVPFATTIISGVEFYDGIVVVRRKSRDLPRLLMKTPKGYLNNWLSEGNCPDQDV